MMRRLFLFVLIYIRTNSRWITSKLAIRMNQFAWKLCIRFLLMPFFVLDSSVPFMPTKETISSLTKDSVRSSFSPKVKHCLFSFLHLQV